MMNEFLGVAKFELGKVVVWKDRMSLGPGHVLGFKMTTDGEFIVSCRFADDTECNVLPEDLMVLQA